MLTTADFVDDMEKWELSYSAVKCKLAKPLGKTVWHYLLKLNTLLMTKPFHSQEYIQQNCVRMHTKRRLYKNVRIGMADDNEKLETTLIFPQESDRL